MKTRTATISPAAPRVANPLDVAIGELRVACQDREDKQQERADLLAKQEQLRAEVSEFEQSGDPSDDAGVKRCIEDRLKIDLFTKQIQARRSELEQLDAVVVAALRAFGTQLAHEAHRVETDVAAKIRAVLEGIVSSEAHLKEFSTVGSRHSDLVLGLRQIAQTIDESNIRDNKAQQTLVSFAQALMDRTSTIRKAS